MVPARGIERWLTQRLSHRLGTGPRGTDGVCAGVRFLTPHSLVAMLLGRERDDPWDPDRLVWPLLQVIDDGLDEPWCATLATHLGHGRGGEEESIRMSRRYSVARRLAGLFGSYAVQRPQLVTDWREGRASDGVGGDLDADLAWQPELLRRVLERVDAPPPDVRHELTLERLRAGGSDLDLPARLSLFGHTRLPSTEVDLLRGLAAVRDVHLWLPQPSALLWEKLGTTAEKGTVPRRQDTSATLAEHPLLSSLGRDTRELRRSLGVFTELDESSLQPSDAVPGTIDVSPRAPVEAPVEPTTLLGMLQSDVRLDRAPDEAIRASRPVAPDDDSVRVHACHSPGRQIDVLREVLVGLLAEDPTLEPRDILVMCPDIETYAPLFQAGFGLADVVAGGQGHPAHQLRVRLADRALTSTNPLLAIAGRLVALAGGRVRATEVLDLAATEPVRLRFGFDTDDLDQLTTWTDHASIRWGLNADTRSPYKLQDLRENTWRAGIDRLLLGVAMAEGADNWLDTVLPLDDVGSGRVDLAGRFAEFVDRLDRTIRTLVAAGPATEWVAALTEGVRAITDVRPDDAWQSAQFERGLAEIGAAAAGLAPLAPKPDGASGPGRTAPSTTLRLADVRVLLEHQLAGRPTRANFRTGTLTVCTMVPMRSVPHRVVALVGLDDGAFPRSGTFDGDDALARDPMTGERDLRSEDRQLLLDALLAATEKLVITYTGANEHSGLERPPSVPLGEILDALALTATHPSGATRGADLVIRHPLQPFDPRNHERGRLGAAPGVPFSFDRAALGGARAQAGERIPLPPLLTEPLPAPAPADVNLADLLRFFADPIGDFLRSVLDVGLPRETEELLDALPIELDGLQKWQVGERMLRDSVNGLDPMSVIQAERRRGELPPRELGTRALTEIVQTVTELVRVGTPLLIAPARSVDVDIDLGEARRLTGTVSGIHGDRIVSITYSSLRAKQRLQAWIKLLAVGAADPTRDWSARLVGRSGAGADTVALGPVTEPLEHLRALVDIYDRGRREPLPLPVDTAANYARIAQRDPLARTVAARAKALTSWKTDRNSPVPGEDAKPAHVRVFGPGAPVDVLLSEPRPGEAWNTSPTRLGQYAVRVWGPLLEHESQGAAR